MRAESSSQGISSSHRNADGKQTIVVVDDSPTIERLFQRVTSDLNVNVEIFASARACQRYLEENKPELLFLNIKMPGKDGLTLLKEIRENPLHEDTAVVIISSKDYAQDRSIAKDLGALEYISKPVPIRVVREVIEKHLNIDPENS